MNHLAVCLRNLHHQPHEVAVSDSHSLLPARGSGGEDYARQVIGARELLSALDLHFINTGTESLQRREIMAGVGIEGPDGNTWERVCEHIPMRTI